MSLISNLFLVTLNTCCIDFYRILQEDCVCSLSINKDICWNLIPFDEQLSTKWKKVRFVLRTTRAMKPNRAM